MTTTDPRTVYAAGHNVAGYLPNDPSDVGYYYSFRNAAAALADTVRRHVEETDADPYADGPVRDAMLDMARIAADDGPEWTGDVSWSLDVDDQRVEYWIQTVEHVDRLGIGPDDVVDADDDDDMPPTPTRVRDLIDAAKCGNADFGRVQDWNLDTLNPNGPDVELPDGVEADDEVGAAIIRGRRVPQAMGFANHEWEACNDMDRADFVSHTMLTGSDYSGGTITRSNVDVLRAILDDAGILESHAVEFSGMHGSYGIAIKLDAVVPDDEDDDARAAIVRVVEAIAGLDDYPIVDEESQSEAEHEARVEAWDSCYRSDWIAALRKRFPCSDDVEFLDDDAVDRLAWAMDTGGSDGIVWEDTDEGVFPSGLDTAAARLTPEYLLSVPGLATIDADAILDDCIRILDAEGDDADETDATNADEARERLDEWIRIRRGARFIAALRDHAVRRLDGVHVDAVEAALRSHDYGDAFHVHRFAWSGFVGNAYVTDRTVEVQDTEARNAAVNRGTARLLSYAPVDLDGPRTGDGAGARFLELWATTPAPTASWGSAST